MVCQAPRAPVTLVQLNRSSTGTLTSESLERLGEESRSTERERDSSDVVGSSGDDSVNSIKLLPLRDIGQCKIESF